MNMQRNPKHMRTTRQTSNPPLHIVKSNYKAHVIIIYSFYLFIINVIHRVNEGPK